MLLFQNVSEQNTCIKGDPFLFFNFWDYQFDYMLERLQSGDGRIRIDEFLKAMTQIYFLFSQERETQLLYEDQVTYPKPTNPHICCYQNIYLHTC